MASSGGRLADIGTDHAYLPIWLCQQDRIPSAIAADVRTGPLEAASANIRLAGLQDRIEVRQSDGLQAFSEDEAETLVLAGMGGKLICRILGDGRDLLSGFQEILLQPQSDIADVRRFLTGEGFLIAEETCTEDEGKFYPVIRAVPNEGMDPSYTETELAFGPCLLKEQDPLLKKWLNKRLETTEQILNDLCGRSSEPAARRKKELQEEKQLLKAALQYYEM